MRVWINLLCLQIYVHDKMVGVETNFNCSCYAWIYLSLSIHIIVLRFVYTILNCCFLVMVRALQIWFSARRITRCNRPEGNLYLQDILSTSSGICHGLASWSKELAMDIKALICKLACLHSTFQYRHMKWLLWSRNSVIAANRLISHRKRHAGNMMH